MEKTNLYDAVSDDDLYESLCGIFWYRRHFTLPENYTGRHITIEQAILLLRYLTAGVIIEGRLSFFIIYIM